MKNYITFLIITFTLLTFGQVQSKFVLGKEFNSVFQDLKNGSFKGTVNGVLLLSKDRKDIILDFQGSEVVLNLEEDINEIYDVSTKSYIGKTTSGKTEILYKTYAGANGLQIQFNNQWFVLSGLDGASDSVIDGLDYTYKAENDYEYLILHFVKTVELSNYAYLLGLEKESISKEKYKLLQEKTETLKVLPNSTLVFIIKRK